MTKLDIYAFSNFLTSFVFSNFGINKKIGTAKSFNPIIVVVTQPRPWSLAICKLANNTMVEAEKKLFLTTSDLIKRINSSLDEDQSSCANYEGMKPQFELQKRLPDGSTMKADEKDMEVADLQSKIKQVCSYMSLSRISIVGMGYLQHTNPNVFRNFLITRIKVR